ncbi:hypothetical protein [Muricoccus pecuniae]|uniref:Uncharacterized protein n=1 Tax=Muricoccus pecuniae TaxID=693023 RepID=A0A840YKN3_9PROT|nr:hypothetical protein [Roseomonas pecuniae]MBB5695492.1 hypothetical protein [Roseomonas pecuniae]
MSTTVGYTSGFFRAWLLDPLRVSDGPLGPATVPVVARDPATAAKLWAATEALTGTRLPADAG